MNVRRILATACASGAIVTGSVLAASPAQAAPPLFASGLVTVVIVDLVDIDDVTVQVPVAAAANICDVNAAVLLAAIEDTGTAECTATASSDARN